MRVHVLGTMIHARKGFGVDVSAQRTGVGFIAFSHVKWRNSKACQTGIGVGSIACFARVMARQTAISIAIEAVSDVSQALF